MVPFLNSKYLFYLFERQNRKETGGDPSFAGTLKMARTGSGQSQSLKPTSISHMSARGPSTWITFHCLPRYISSSRLEPVLKMVSQAMAESALRSHIPVWAATGRQDARWGKRLILTKQTVHYSLQIQHTGSRDSNSSCNVHIRLPGTTHSKSPTGQMAGTPILQDRGSGDTSIGSYGRGCRVCHMLRSSNRGWLDSWLLYFGSAPC